MGAKRPARGPRVLRNQPPLDAEQIVAAAVELTRKHGLDFWTIRQLGGELECWPAVIYHHVGDRDTVACAVVDHVVGTVPEIDSSVPWRDGLRAQLNELRVVLREHPGVARWLALNGPVVPAVLRLVDRGVQTLAAAGLGGEAPAAHSVLMNSVLLLIAMEDERDTQPFLCEEIDRTLNAYLDSTAHPGLAQLAAVRHEELRADHFYRYTVDRALDGVEARLAVLSRVRPPA